MKKSLKIISWAVLVLTAGFLLANYQELRLNPFESVELDMVSKAVYADNGLIVADRGSERIVKIDSDGKAEYVLESERGAEFSYVQDIAVSGESFYASDLIWNPDGMSIYAERILEFDVKTGKFKDVITEIFHEERQCVPSFGGLSANESENGISFVSSDYTGFEVFLIDEDGGVNSRRFIQYDNALIAFQDFSVTTDGVYALDKSGKIMYYDLVDNSEEVVVYTPKSTGNNPEEFVLPLCVTADSFGNVLFADIGQRSICEVNPNGDVSEVYISDD
ncbi:MAG: hypothetical protein FWF82_06100 [Oscillospiraceae bacterium]|nr:hypothetical protein [Oscillospiraceae bacterium]